MPQSVGENTPAPPDTDAELIALCGEFDRVERALQAIPDDEALFQPLYDASHATQDAALRRICEIPATTLEGLRARAASARLWNAERDYHPAWEAYGILMFEEAIWRDLGGRPHALEHDAPYIEVGTRIAG